MTATRDFIAGRLKQDLIGPHTADEVLDSYPSDVYMTGILFPQYALSAPEESERLHAEGAADNSGTADDEINHQRLQRPPSFGVSFALEAGSGLPEIAIEFVGARYHIEYPDQASQAPASAAGLDSDLDIVTDSSRSPSDSLTLARSADGTSYNVEEDTGDREEDKEPNRSWRRKALSGSVDAYSVSVGSSDVPATLHGLDCLRLNVTCSEWGSRLLVTVTAINTNESSRGAERVENEEHCLFQTQLTVRCANLNTRFHPRPLRSTAAGEDSESARLLYRNAAEYAVGHTCSATWTRDEDYHVASVSTAWFGHALVPDVSSSGESVFEGCVSGALDPFSALWISNTDGTELTEGLETVVAAYETWLTRQAERIPHLNPEFQSTARKHIEVARSVVDRMRGSIALIGSDPNVRTAFRLANKAIVVQRHWGNPTEHDLRWRPFQLAFILLSLESVADRGHADRDVADLIWFPTGGGKTEAYLGLIAFVLFIRRLRDADRGAGVAAIMRYTLRLLTVQQFQRAATLICACERMRIGEFLPDGLEPDLGTTRYSIGLWVGKDSVPNKIADAAVALRDGSASTPRQLTTCPCEKHEPLRWFRARAPDSIRVACTGGGCLWNDRQTTIPVWTVDEDLYRERPSLIIGTIDKFAQVVRNPDTIAIFGGGSDVDPPDLIIQDELHLISGPLGTIAGLYESAIDELCSSGEVRPKIVASTATIREAKAQIRALFNRGTCLFPPPVIDASNSGFSVVDTNAPGRLYLGLTTAGRSAKYMLQAVSASILQSTVASLQQDAQDADWYATMVAYFNSLRELGGALVLMQDDVERTLADISSRRSELPRNIHEVTELTSRVSSSEVRDILDKLEFTHQEDGSIDVLLASNMISVGVDISRLGVMVVNGQPKGMAEYIQATSRVGRGKVPGLVVTIYNDAKARDRSHFETFRTWHETIYRDVEATSVTPFSSRARDRALHAALVALARHLIREMRGSPVLSSTSRQQVEELADRIALRASEVDEPEAAAVASELHSIIDRWSRRAGLRSYWNDRQVNTSLLMSAEAAARRRAVGRTAGQAWPTPNSMRNVEAATTFVSVRRLR